MKKFLSLVLALIMTMSLVTIGASAAEYDDFTDKDEIKYEEAVAVLNKLGIITGYSEGDFRPEGELTRGAAAKIIVSLLIGPEAAENVSPTSAPYSDVPLDHTFAGPIAYCKTAGIINGYTDGSFHPGDTLTGYAFSKMLLGALGYKSDIEHFTGSGWNMNVNARAAEAGLFDRISFKGNDPVNREEACQLALNTLKATMVEYTGGFTVNAGDASVTGAQNRSYKTSNQEYASHINNKKAGGNLGTAADALYTVEFGEEHFVDLRMDADRNAKDDFGRVSNKWSYKKVTIGTYAVEPDFSYDKQVSHIDDTDGAKRRATGLGDYRVNSNTTVWVNGYPIGVTLSGVEDIADYTDNGTVVEVYVSDETADLITDVVVIQTQLMEIKRVGSDYVSLQMYDNGKSDNIPAKSGYNQASLNLKVEDVQTEDSTYKTLSALKAGDIVAVVPVAIDHTNKYDVAEAYVPETVTGALTGVKDYGKTGSDSSAITVTVGGTVYNIANWSKDLIDITGEKIKVTRKDVTLYLDKAGNAMLGKDVGATNDWMIVGNFRQTLENGQINWVVNGWDISGAELSLNVGPTQPNAQIREGDLVKYSSATTGKADWTLGHTESAGVYTVYAGTDSDTTAAYRIKSSNDKVALDLYDDTNHALNGSGVMGTDYGKEYLDKSAKFIYVRFDDSGEVEGIDVRTDVQNVDNDELLKTANGSILANAQADGSNCNRAQAALKVDSSDPTKNVIKAVVIKTESGDAAATNMLYIRDYISGADKEDSTGKIVYGYTVAMLTKDGFEDNKTIYSYKNLNKGDFASYIESTNDTFSPFYELSGKNDRVGKSTSVFYAEVNDVKTDNLRKQNKNLLSVENIGEIRNHSNPLTAQIAQLTNSTLGEGNGKDTVNLRYAEFVDLVTDNGSISTVDDLANYKNAKVALIVNDDPSKDNFRRVAMIVVLSATPKTDDAAAPVLSVSPASPVNLNKGDSQSLTVTVTNASVYDSLAYQWLADGVEIAGATSASYSVPTAEVGSVSYTVRVTGTDNDKADSKTATTLSDAVVVNVTDPNAKTVTLTLSAGTIIDFNGVEVSTSGEQALTSSRVTISNVINTDSALTNVVVKKVSGGVTTEISANSGSYTFAVADGDEIQVTCTKTKQNLSLTSNDANYVIKEIYIDSVKQAGTSLTTVATAPGATILVKFEAKLEADTTAATATIAGATITPTTEVTTDGVARQLTTVTLASNDQAGLDAAIAAIPDGSKLYSNTSESLTGATEIKAGDTYAAANNFFYATDGTKAVVEVSFTMPDTGAAVTITNITIA